MNKGNYEKKSKRIHKNNANHRRILSLYFNTEVNNENFNHYRFRYNRDVTINNRGTKKKIKHGDMTNIEQRKGVMNREYRKEIEKHYGKKIEVMLNGNYFQMSVPEKNQFNKWWKQDSNPFGQYTYYNREEISGKTLKFSVTAYQKPLGEIRFKQIFADNKSNRCLLQPIENWIKKLKNKYIKNSYENKMDIYKIQYISGVPEDKMKELCNAFAIGIDIDIPFGNEPFIKERPDKKTTQKTFRFLNIRENHVVHNKTFDRFLCLSDEPIYKTKGELETMVENNKEDGAMWYCKSRTGMNRVIYEEKVYQYKSEYIISKKQFEDEYNMKLFDFDLNKYPELTTFVFDSIHQINHYNFQDEIVGIECSLIDQSKAYADAWKNTEFFEGFIGKITDFRQADKIDSLGFYFVSEMDLTKCPEILKSHFTGNNVYASPVLKFLIKHGAEIQVTHKAVGMPFNFTGFPEYMYETENGVKHYQRYIGHIQHQTTHNRFYSKGSKKFVFNLQFLLNNTKNAVYQKVGDDNEFFVEFQRKKDFACPQFASMLIAYQNIAMMEQLLKMDISKVYRVAVDGIYYQPHKFTLTKSFREKEEHIIPDAITSDSLFSRMDASTPKVNAPSRPFYERELFVGAGGNGKTYYNLKDEGHINVCYLAPSHKLRRNKENDFKVDTLCWQMILNNQIDSERVKLFKQKFNVVIIDEVSMISNDAKHDLIHKLKDLKLVFCGDLGFQLPPINGEYMDLKYIDNVYQMKGNYRFKDDKQKTITSHLRQMIKENKTGEEMLKYAIKAYQTITKEDLMKEYKTKDIVLCSLHEICDIWTNTLKGDKYKCNETNREYCVGDIIHEKPPNTKWEKRHGYTIHSVQGEDFNDNIYIDIRHFFQREMLYTAVSRAKYSHQIKFIVGEPEVKVRKGYVYKIVSPNTEEIYIGSTYNKNERWKDHLKGNDTTSNQIINKGDAEMKILWKGVVGYNEKTNYSKSLKRKENEFINSTPHCVNKILTKVYN